MPRVNRIGDDRGSAALEFATLGLLMLVPLVYLIVLIGVIQAGALAAEGAARQAARVVTLARTEAEARAAAERAVALAFADAGVEGADITIELTCRPRPETCLTRRGIVTVTVSADVPLPLVPPILGADVPPSVRVEARSVQQVSRFHGGQ
jgi:Flp pilus assembly protein TadG